MAEKVTTMAIKVDLQCHKCYKKIQKILCKIPQIRDRVFDEKKGTVIITVVCCCPEKIKQKIRCKGGKCITDIAIIEPSKTKPEPDNQHKKPDEPKPEAEQPKPKPPVTISGPVLVCCPPPPPPPARYPFGSCCRECSEGIPGGPCFHGGCPPPPCYDRYYYGRPVYDSWGGGGCTII